MHADDEIILRMSKEILVKFIELQRVSPTNFDEHFKRVFWAIKSTVVDARIQDFKSEVADGEKLEDL